MFTVYGKSDSGNCYKVGLELLGPGVGLDPLHGRAAGKQEDEEKDGAMHGDWT